MKPMTTHAADVEEFVDFWEECSAVLGNEDEDEEEVAQEDSHEDDEDAEEATAWLGAVGMESLATPFRSGREVAESDLALILATLPRRHKEAVRKRVATLNIATVRRKMQSRHKYPDIRDVFAPSKSRMEKETENASADSVSVPDFVQIFQPDTPGKEEKQQRNKVARVHQHKDAKTLAWPGGPDGDVAGDTGNDVKMLTYHNFGTVYMPGYVARKQSSGSTPASTNAAVEPGFERAFREARLNNASTDSEPKWMTEEEKCGWSTLEDLSSEDVTRLTRLILLELTSIGDKLDIPLGRRKRARRRKRKKEGAESGVFGVSLDVLMERDRNLSPDVQIPLVFSKLLNHLEKCGLREEGILRISGHRQRTLALRQVFDTSFYADRDQVDKALAQSTPHEVAALLKQFLRELPEPLLSAEIASSCLLVAESTKLSTQLEVLNLLILLLPPACRCTLLSLVKFLDLVADNGSQNKMALRSVAMIMAPNLFLACGDRFRNSLQSEMNVAASTCRITELLLRHHKLLWRVPPYLVRDSRRIREEELARQNNKPMKRLARRIGRDKPDDKTEEKCEDSGITVMAPQLSLPDEVVPVETTTSVADVILWLVDAAQLQMDNLKRLPPKQGGSSVVSCLLNSIDSAEDALATHSLYEVGGNIGFRRLPPNALLSAVREENPGATWQLRCNHRTKQV